MPMYDEVVIDVMKLREEAREYGRSVLLEQIAPKIDEAISSILEQDPFDDEEGKLKEPGLPPEPGQTNAQGVDSDLGDEMGLGAGEEDTGLESELAENLPLAAMEGEDTCSCPDDDDEIEIDFDNLMKTSQPPEGEAPLEEPRGGLYEQEELDEDLNLDEVDLEQFEEGLMELAEELEVDLSSPEKTGWGDVPEAELDHIEDLNIASAMDDKRKKEFKAKQKALDSLKENYEQLEQENILLEKRASNYKRKIKEFEDVVLKQQQKLRSLTTMNSRLLYVNKVLTNESLNGLQKQKIVESLEKAKTPEEAKLIFETLQSTVGSQVKNRQPKSRSEVAHNSPQTLVVKPVKVKQQTNRLDESTKGRLQKLAGIIK